MTIEERAKGFVEDNFEGWEDQGIMDMCADAYESGAREQRQIDADLFYNMVKRDFMRWVDLKGGKIEVNTGKLKACIQKKIIV